MSTKKTLCKRVFFFLLFCLSVTVLPETVRAQSTDMSAQSTAANAKDDTTASFPSLPIDLTSFGCATDGEWVYLYGGHSGKIHSHSQELLGHKLYRIKLDGSQSEWEVIGKDLSLQGLTLEYHDHSLYRIGGMHAKNKTTAEEEVLLSQKAFKRFDLKTHKWHDLTSLPEARSTHGSTLYKNKIYVAAGWELDGPSTNFHDTLLSFDLTQKDAKWEEVSVQPFARRALSVVAFEDKIYVVGGLTETGNLSTEVDIYDLKTNAWSKGPAIPVEGESGALNGFAPGACVVGGSLYISAADGILYRLDTAQNSWERINQLKNARFMHRLIPGLHEKSILALGGASMEGQTDSVESIPLK
ncbi:MAG: hypothetical protein MPJ24_08740, partial [Pirellulaceae bacterium]|nr:hypothetical protein [Pirellulaceae bacterium]